MAYETAEFAPIRHPPVGETECFILIHIMNVIQGFIPPHGKLGEIAIFKPGQPCQVVQHCFAARFKSGDWPGQAFSEVSILAGPGAVDLRTGCVIASCLPCLQIGGQIRFPKCLQSLRFHCLSHPEKIYNVDDHAKGKTPCADPEHGIPELHEPLCRKIVHSKDPLEIHLYYPRNRKG